MTTIRILPEILSNQIAAGEVVERPVSVVKELVENSIDAGARYIIIEIQNGGKSLIRVSDDGIGLSRDDALLAIERYATSKLHKDQNLFAISTMGFRGEALPSIASVSKFSITTRTADSDTATRLEIHGGKLKDVRDAGAPQGTMVEVKSLFYNTPARKKFLKSDTTEISHIADLVSGMAMGNPGIQFKLVSNGRLVKHYPSGESLFQRTVKVLGKEVAEKLYPIELEQEGLKISGYCANPVFSRSTGSRIYLFVNNRIISDRGLISAIFQGYRGRILKGRFPLAALFVEINFDQVDINVHPSKKQVRFFNHQQVYQAVSNSISSAFASAQEQISEYSRVLVNEDKPVAKEEKPEPLASPRPSISSPISLRSDSDHKVEQTIIEWGTDNSKRPEPISENKHEKCHKVSSVTTANEPGIISGSDDLKILGQIMGTYILVETGDHLRLVDQHAAHERIIYESLLKRHENLETASQQLIVPETLELSYKEADALKNITEDLSELGFEIEPFGGTTFIIKSVPSMIDDKKVQSVVMDIIDHALQGSSSTGRNEWLDNILVSMACHSAVRANKSMELREMFQLIHDLEQCDNPMHCPHGRPAVITMTRKELEKLFKRVV